jgi:RNA polymerase sigma factor (sigma-70 family)
LAAVEHRSRAGDATHDLYSQYGKQIYAYCLHKLRSKEEAEDAVQTTFMNAFRSLQRGTQTQFEQAWLFKIAHNVCVARATSSSRRLRLEAPNDFEVLQEVVPAKDPDSDSLELMGIEEALELMPENQRRAILLREWQGLSYREISQELGLSQAAVEMLIFRARRALAGALEQPEEAKAKHGRAARRVASMIAGVGGALKTLIGGSAAIKAVTIAAAAVAVVGESGAQHTIVKQQPRQHPAKVARVSIPVAAVEHRVAAVTKTRVVASVRPAKRVVRHIAPLHVTHAAPVTPAHVDQPPAEPVPAPAAAPAPAPAPVAVPAPAVEKAAVSVSTIAPNTPVQPPAAPAPAPPADEPPVAPAPAPVPAPATADPGQGNNGNGNANGHDKDHGKPPEPTPAPAPAPAPVIETTLSVPSNGNGNGNAFGHDKQHGGNQNKP